MKKTFYIVTLILLIGLILGYKELYNYKNLTSELIEENNNLQNSLKEYKNKKIIYSNDNNKLKNQIVYLENNITNLKNKIVYLENNITNLKDKIVYLENNITNLKNMNKIIIVPKIDYSLKRKDNIKDLNLSKPKSFEIENKKKDDGTSFSPTIDVDMEEKAVKGFHINYTSKF